MFISGFLGPNELFRGMVEWFVHFWGYPSQSQNTVSERRSVTRMKDTGRSFSILDPDGAEGE
jgi:hypothetical protein